MFRLKGAGVLLNAVLRTYPIWTNYLAQIRIRIQDSAYSNPDQA